MSLPLYPDLDQVAYESGVFYQWTGSKWKRLDTLSTPDFIESTDIGLYSGNTASTGGL